MRRFHVLATAVYAAVAVCIAGLSLGIAGLSPPESETYCADQVISDWVKDGVVTDRYQLSCYRAAIRSLPEDMRTYTSAGDDINRPCFAPGIRGHDPIVSGRKWPDGIRCPPSADFVHRRAALAR